MKVNRALSQKPSTMRHHNEALKQTYNRKGLFESETLDQLDTNSICHQKKTGNYWKKTNPSSRSLGSKQNYIKVHLQLIPEWLLRRAHLSTMISRLGYFTSQMCGKLLPMELTILLLLSTNESLIDEWTAAGSIPMGLIYKNGNKALCFNYKDISIESPSLTSSVGGRGL